jgi:hypothetical protein
MPASERTTADGTGAGNPPGGSAGIAGAVLFGVINVVLIAVAPYPSVTPRVRPGAAPSFQSVPPVAAPKAACDACDRIRERCRELCGRDGAANPDRTLERLAISTPGRCDPSGGSSSLGASGLRATNRPGGGPVIEMSVPLR